MQVCDALKVQRAHYATGLALKVAQECRVLDGQRWHLQAPRETEYSLVHKVYSDVYNTSNGFFQHGAGVGMRADRVTKSCGGSEEPVRKNLFHSWPI